MSNVQYQRYRARNTEAVRRHRLKAKEERSRPEWVTEHPSLSELERMQAARFLDGLSASPDATTRGLLRKHLVARRQATRDHCNELLRRLASLEENP